MFVNLGIVAAYCVGIPYEYNITEVTVLGMTLCWWQFMTLLAVVPAILQVGMEKDPGQAREGCRLRAGWGSQGRQGRDIDCKQGGTARTGRGGMQTGSRVGQSG